MNMQFWEATFPKAEALAVGGLESYAFALLARWKQALQDGFVVPFCEKKPARPGRRSKSRDFSLWGRSVRWSSA